MFSAARGIIRCRLSAAARGIIRHVNSGYSYIIIAGHMTSDQSESAKSVH